MSIVEITTFRLAADADSGDFLRADRDVQSELFSPAPGFLRRTTARGADGEWVVVTLWRSEADADAMDAEHPTARAFARLVEPASLIVRRYTPLD